jgi:demethylmenaquinone methyltransferase/2-methoxy-6-polyprenyl-1,4-benzoquinol methylase
MKNDRHKGVPQPPAPVEDERETAPLGTARTPTAEKTRRVQDHFDAVASRYDLMNTLLSFGIHYRWKGRAIRRLGLQPGESVVDICGGTGDLSVLALKRMPGAGPVALVDLNRSMMLQGRRKTTHAAFRQHILFVQGDAERLPFGTECFDAAMVGFGVRNLTHLEEGFREIYRVLKPGGRFVCLEFSQPTSAWFRRLYDVYSFSVMPLIGRLVTGSRQAYTYLPESIRLFPAPAALSRILDGIGFVRVTYEPLTNGVAVIHRGYKGDSAASQDGIR